MPQPRHEKKFLYKALLFANACKNPFYTAPVDKMPSPEEIAEYKPFKKNGEPN